MLCFALVRIRDEFRLTKWLSGRLIVYLGALSYIVYISHYQLFKLMDPSGLGGWKWLPIKVVAAFLLGIALYKWVEQPIQRRFRKRLAHQVPAKDG